jgi:hypothetical protein
MRRAIHSVALVALGVVALVGIAGTIRSPLPGVTSVQQILHPILGLAFWSFLIWKIWKSPGKWGWGVGIFLWCLIAFQTYLWWLAITSPKPNYGELGIYSLRNPTRGRGCQLSFAEREICQRSHCTWRKNFGAA